MKFLPSAADSSLYGWEVLVVTLAAAMLPATAVFIWVAFFRKRGRRKSRRRRRDYPAANPVVLRTNGAPPAFDRENVPGEPRS